MRQIVYLACLCVLSAVTSAVPSANAPKDSVVLEKSYSKWKTVKKSCEGNYSYTVSTYGFTGIQNTTEVVVRRGKVVERSHTVFLPVECVLIEWVENESNLNSHLEGAPALTMDQLYQLARRVLAVKIKDVWLRRQFAILPNGLLQSCYIYDSRIADDNGAAEDGVDIDTLTLVIDRQFL